MVCRQRIGRWGPSWSSAGALARLTWSVTMLVLMRKVGETIVIAEDIVVKVTSIDGDRVRLGIVAPCDVPVDRSEFRARRRAGLRRRGVGTCRRLFLIAPRLHAFDQDRCRLQPHDAEVRSLISSPSLRPSSGRRVP